MIKYILVYTKSDRLYWIHFDDEDEAKRVNKDLKGLIIKGEYYSHNKGSEQ